MNWADIPEEVRTRFKILVADPLGLDFAIDNDEAARTFDPKGEHARIYIKTGDSDQRSFGEFRRVRTVGVVIIVIRVPISSGDRRAKEIAVAIRNAAFNGVSSNGVTFRFPSLKEMGRQGSWYQVNLAVPFQYDEML